MSKPLKRGGSEGVNSVQVSISARHGHLSEATQAKISAKAEKLARLFDRLTSIEVTIDLENEDMPGVDINVSAEHKHDFVATDRSSSLMGSLDGALHKIEQQLRKYKDKVLDRHRQPGVKQQELALEVDEEDEEDEDI